MNIIVKGILLIGFVTLFACNKDITILNPVSKGWTINGIFKHQYSCSLDTNDTTLAYFGAFDTVWQRTVPVSFLNIRFSKRQPLAGQYTIKGYVYNRTSYYLPDTVVEITGTNNYRQDMIGPYGPARDFDFAATGYNMPKLTVSYINSKLKIDVPGLWVYRFSFPNFMPPPYQDSVKLSGTMLQD